MIDAAPIPPHLRPLPQGEEEEARNARVAFTCVVCAKSFLSLGERIKVRGCRGESRKLVTCGRHPRQPSVACGVGFETINSTAISSAGSIGSVTGLLTSSATRRSSRSNSTDQVTATRRARRRTAGARVNCWIRVYASSASGTKKSSEISTGSSKPSFCSSIQRNRAGARSTRPHLSPLPEGEEEDRARARFRSPRWSSV